MIGFLVYILIGVFITSFLDRIVIKPIKYGWFDILVWPYYLFETFGTFCGRKWLEKRYDRKGNGE